MGVEFELKYRLPQEALETIAAKMGPGAVFEMETAYYDNPTRDFALRKWTLRRRMENGTSVCTLKTPMSDGSRGEWEVLADSIEAGIPELCKLDIPAGLENLAKDGLVQVCAARFTRLAKTILLENATVELALDEGCLLGGGKTLPFAEVEVELKQGSETAAVDFASALALEFDLTLEKKSKHRRALELTKN